MKALHIFSQGKILILLVLLNLTLYFHTQAQSKVINEELLQTSKGVVMVIANYEESPEFGAGIIIAREKGAFIIATADHILHRGTIQPSSIKVSFYDWPEKFVDATLIRSDSGGLDVAVLNVKDPSDVKVKICPPLDRMGSVSEVGRGDEVFPIGNPNGASWAIPVEPDHISQISEDYIVFQSSFISGGHSGGALLNAAGKIIGMTVMDEPPFGRAIGINRILDKVRSWGLRVQLSLETAQDETPLHLAATENNFATLRNLLNACSNPNARNKNWATPLHLAAVKGNPEIVSFLLKSGANKFALDKAGESALFYATRGGDLATLKILVGSGIEVNQKNKVGDAVIHEALKSRRSDFLNTLIKAGADVNLKNGNYYSPLYIAAKQNNYDLVEILLAAGATEEGPTMFSLITDLMQRDKPEQVRRLLRAFKEGDNAADAWKGQLLRMAISINVKLEIIKLLVSEGADVNFRGENSVSSPVEYAMSPLFEAIYMEKLEVAEFLLSKGGRVEADSGSLKGSLPYVLFRGQEWNKFAKLLISAGALEIPSAREDFPGAIKNSIDNDNIEMLRMLLKAKPYRDAIASDEETPLQSAVRDGKLEIIKILLGSGATVNDVSQREERSPLELAIYYKHPEVIKLLLLSGANYDTKSRDGTTLLTLYQDTFKGKQDAEIINLLSGKIRKE